MRKGGWGGVCGGWGSFVGEKWLFRNRYLPTGSRCWGVEGPKVGTYCFLGSQKLIY
jgi:hypothetical protein